MSANNTLRLPGLVDVHVHLRDPGQTQKEDFATGSAAALAGGYTDIFDMPNNLEPITSKLALDNKINSARHKTVCNIGFYFGSLGDNLDQFELVRDQVYGLKLYLNATTGNYLLEPGYLMSIFKAWSSPKPILLHAEADVISNALEITASTGQATHVCHVSSRAELEPIIEAKKSGLPVTCGVTPHHLFLSDKDGLRLGVFGAMKPALKPKTDQDYLWNNLDKIDVIESDHAPHTRPEKIAGAFGVPGLETSLPLMLQAQQEGRLSIDTVVAMCADNPRRILGLSEDPNTYIEVSPTSFKIGENDLKTKCGWTPFVGRTGFGKVSSVFIRNRQVLKNGKVVAKPGDGRVL